MSVQLTDMLLDYLGQLMHQRENSFDLGENITIDKKIEAVNVLLNIKEPEIKKRDLLKYLGFQ